MFGLGTAFDIGGKAFAVAGVGYDYYQYKQGEITKGAFVTNTAVTGGLLIVGAVSAPAALIGGALYFGWQYIDPESHKIATDCVDSKL